MMQMSQPVGNEFERDIDKAVDKLQGTKVYSKQEKEDYGEIPFREFFKGIIYKPNSPLKMKWICYFLSGFSAKWTYPCLFAIREFFHNLSIIISLNCEYIV